MVKADFIVQANMQVLFGWSAQNMEPRLGRPMRHVCCDAVTPTEVTDQRMLREKCFSVPASGIPNPWYLRGMSPFRGKTASAQQATPSFLCRPLLSLLGPLIQVTQDERSMDRHLRPHEGVRAGDSLSRENSRSLGFGTRSLAARRLPL